MEDHDVARLQRRDEELFDIGVEALAVDGPIEQAGRVDAVVAQGGEEELRSSSGREEPCRRGALPSAPSRAGGSCWSSSRFHR